MLANLGSPGFPSVVYYRLPDESVIFSKQKKDQEIKVKHQKKIPLDDLVSFVVESDKKFHEQIKAKENRV